ncbi:hypothetical protein SAPIO_CDS6072 [Scedosporium apiospermum]|uniref:Myb-like DNA-binding domain protein n=1 Tax=Pseudallescheria apiosperma TaxID=563466 RepID=A0A084G4G0_PSEDA|nr:uncharacterized protein SAPIO_CDS6072 [Scedosporium apiospermum]KEZ42222.1 hypothetical protein SAPIO_CDS6072 [Scedosporium apiospermum]
MEPRRKRPRLELDLHNQSEDDDDELNYDPEEISRKRDPGFRLAQSRATAAFRLKSTFESIFEKYERDFSGVGDEIDLRTGEIVVDNGHLQKMRNEKDVGLDLTEAGIEMSGSSASTTAGGAVDGATVRSAQGQNNRQSPRYETSEDEDRILGGDKTTGTHEGIINGPMALVPYASNHRPAHLHTPSNASLYPSPVRLGSQPYFGASPLFFNSWSPSGAGDPIWNAPQIEVPRFRSSFATSLYANRYQLPAREGSRSIWAPRSKKDDDEEELDPLPKLRVRPSPPTRRVPARPVMAKLIRAHPESGGDSGDEECILMGSKIDPTPAPEDGPKRGVNRGDIVSLSNGRQTSVEHNEMIGTTAQPVTQTQSDKIAERGGGELTPRTKLPPPGKDRTRRAKIHQLMPARESGLKSRRSSRETVSPGKEAASTATATTMRSAAVAQGAILAPPDNEKRRWSNSVVVELSSSHLFDDSYYLDLSNMSDDSRNPPPSSRLSVECDTGDSQNDALSAPKKVIPDSQTSDSSITEPLEHIPDTVVASLPMCSSANDTHQQLARNAYDLSDEEQGFVSNSAASGRHLPSAKECSSSLPSSSHKPVDRGRLDEVRIAGKWQGETAVPSMKNVPTDSSPAALFSPIKTRFARARARSVTKSSKKMGPSALDVDVSAASTTSLKRAPKPLPLTNITPSSGERPSSSHALPLQFAPPQSEAPRSSTHGLGIESQPSDGTENTVESTDIVPSHSDHGSPSPQSSREPPCLGGNRQHASDDGVSEPSTEVDTSRSAQMMPKDSDRTASVGPESKDAAKLDSSKPIRSGIQAIRQDTRLKCVTAHRSTKKLGRKPSTHQRNGAVDHISQAESSLSLQTGKPMAGSCDEKPIRQQPPRHLSPTATPKSKMLLNDTTPKSHPSTGHRSLTSLIPEAGNAFSPNDSEDELTLSSSAFRTIFGRPISSKSSITDTARVR